VRRFPQNSSQLALPSLSQPCVIESPTNTIRWPPVRASTSCASTVAATIRRGAASAARCPARDRAPAPASSPVRRARRAAVARSARTGPGRVPSARTRSARTCRPPAPRRRDSRSRCHTSCAPAARAAGPGWPFSRSSKRPTHATQSPRVGLSFAMSRNDSNEPPVGSVGADVAVATQARWQLDRRRPARRFVVREADVRSLRAAVLAQQHRQPLAVGERTTPGSHRCTSLPCQIGVGAPHVRPPSVERVWNTVNAPCLLPGCSQRPSSWKNAACSPFASAITLAIATMPPNSPIGSSGVQVRPSSSDSARRIGRMPENRTSRALPARSTRRWIVGVSWLVAQFSGTGSGALHVRPPSLLFCSTIGPLPCPSGCTQRIAPSGSSTVVGWPW
jgi:hypothetical protein